MEDRTPEAVTPVVDSQAVLDERARLNREFYETHAYDKVPPLVECLSLTEEWANDDAD